MLRRRSAELVAQERGKHRNQLDEIMALLRLRGERGATSEELYAIARRFGGRLFEARRAGAIIEVRQLSPGLYLYILRRDIQRRPISSLPPKTKSGRSPPRQTTLF